MQLKLSLKILSNNTNSYNTMQSHESVQTHSTAYLPKDSQSESLQCNVNDWLSLASMLWSVGGGLLGQGRKFYT